MRSVLAASLVVAMFGNSGAHAQAIDCRAAGALGEHMNGCSRVLANDADREMRRAWDHLQACYVRHYPSAAYRDRKPRWLPENATSPLEHLITAQNTWLDFRHHTCLGQTTQWQGSVVIFEANMCLLRETENRIGSLHKQIAGCGLNKNGEPRDQAGHAFEHEYVFFKYTAPEATTVAEYGRLNDCDVSSAGTWSQAKVVCEQEHSGRAFEVMTTAYTNAVTRIAGLSDRAALALETSQDRWGAFVETTCEADALVFENGSLMEWRRAACLRKHALDRADYLNSLDK